MTDIVAPVRGQAVKDMITSLADTITTLRAEVAALREGLAAAQNEMEKTFADPMRLIDSRLATDAFAQCMTDSRALLETNHAK